MLAFLATPMVAPQVAFSFQIQTAQAATTTPIKSPSIPAVPFFSQFKDIQSPQWQEVGCGITSLAMMIDFYKPDAVSVNSLLNQGIAAGAYDQVAGWTYDGLIQLSEKYGLTGTFHDLSQLTTKTALSQFRGFLKSGPLILSVFNQFNPNSAVPHLVVIDGIKNNTVYYNDPAAKVGEKKISVANLLKGWKKKVIVLRPVKTAAGSGLSLK